MSAELDGETIEKLRRMGARQALLSAKSAVYRTGAVSSNDFLEIYTQLVNEGVVTWDQVDEFERGE